MEHFATYFTFYIGMAEWLSLIGSMLGLMWWFDRKYERLDEKFENKFIRFENRFVTYDERFARFDERFARFEDKVDRLYQMYVEMMKEVRDRSKP